MNIMFKKTFKIKKKKKKKNFCKLTLSNERLGPKLWNLFNLGTIDYCLSSLASGRAGNVNSCILG